MSAGLFQTLPGAHEMGGAGGLPSEPWLLPISDRAASAKDAADGIAETVRQSSRRVRIAANTLCAALALLLSAQIASDWRGAVSNPGTGQIAEAMPPVLASEKASFTAGH